MKKKILVASFPILIAGIIFLVGFNTKTNEEQKENTKIVDTENLLSYTIDGSPATERPTKESGYIANSIKCDNGSILVWDNDSWTVELIEPKSNDRCVVDFTKNTSASGYRITATSTIEGALESYSKATTNGGRVEIYSKNGVEIKTVSGCTGTVENNKVVISNVTQNQTCNIEIAPTLANYVKLEYKPQEGRTDFSVIDNGTPALYTEKDDQGTTYYFSGDGSSMNNWVKFVDKWWRIIRINGNGSVRLLYAGDGNDATDIGSSTFNSASDHPQYVGWKYTEGDSLSTNRQNGTPSSIYSVVETWYNGLNTANKNYIDTNVIYCNDRNIESGDEYDIYDMYHEFYYIAYEKLETNKTPTFTCSNTSDRFTTFGLMTADEVAYAGGVYNTNSPKAYYYLAKDGTSSIIGSNGWWTMSPYGFLVANHRRAHVFIVDGSDYPGHLYTASAHGVLIVRPVVSLKSNTWVSGTGTASDPYVVQGLQ